MNAKKSSRREWDLAGSSCRVWDRGERLIASVVILIVQGVPTLNLLVLILQTLVPVFESLPFGGYTELTATCQRGRVVSKRKVLALNLQSSHTWQTFTNVVVGLADVIIPHGDI